MIITLGAGNIWRFSEEYALHLEKNIVGVKKLKLLTELRSIVRGSILENEPMSRHTTYGIGGPVTAFITPCDKDDLSSILRFSKDIK